MRSIENSNNFMQPYIYQGNIVEFESNEGTEYVPEDAAPDMPPEWEYIELHVNTLYGRLSASGYLDCTPWTIGASEDAVLDDLEDSYGD